MDIMKEAIIESMANKENNYQKGGPFGAVIVYKGKIIAKAHNTVIESHDATAHAEINAIRKACTVLNSHDLSGCVLYTSTEPCPMCLSAIIWSNIKEVYYANTKEDANEIGFRDDIIYEYLKGKNKDLIHITQVNREKAIKVFEDFKENPDKKIY